MEKRYDVAIVGTGPAGLSAAITLKIRNKNILLIGNENSSEKVVKAHTINNYLGIKEVKGEDLAAAFIEHVNSMGIQLTDEKITAVYAMGDYYSLQTSTNKIYEASSIIMATGVNFGKTYDGEETFLGRGVSYCATCDAPLYKDKTVAVVGYSAKEEEEVVFLSEVAKKIYFIPMYKDKIERTFADNVDVIYDVPKAITGGMKADKLILDKQELMVDGIFILRESVAPSQLVFGIKMDGNHIEVNRKMETNLKGCFACGDVVGTPYQYIKAAGEGNVAALSAVSYIDELKRNTVNKNA